MPDSEYTRLIQAAKERALSGFFAAMQCTVQDAERNIVGLLMKAKPGSHESTLTAVRHFLPQEGDTLLRRIDTLYRQYLDRAMQTMYVDFRPGMRQLDANELALINDEVVNHQIEVSRLAARMREANEESIGRLNVIIARLHGEVEARERENPFRPYLLARTLYEATRQMVSEEPKARVLFDQLASALIAHLPAYYSALREVFESSGIHGKFVTQKSKAVPHQRYFGAPLGDPPPAINTRLMTSMQHLLEAFQQNMPVGEPGTVSKEGGSLVIHDFIQQMFQPTLVARKSPIGQSLVAQLGRLQQSTTLEATDTSPAQSMLRKIDFTGVAPAERMTVEVVTMLFDIMLADERVPPPLRRHIAQLQLPMVKAAVLDPAFLRDKQHPARQLLNRFNSAALSADPASRHGRDLMQEIDSITRSILAEFETDTAVFMRCLQRFDLFLTDHFLREDNRLPISIDAVETAEKFCVLLANTTQSLRDTLLPLDVDARISDFILKTWPRVLVTAAWEDAERGSVPERPDSLFQRYRAVLPALLWSIGEKTDQQQRSELVRLLPNLVKRLRQGMQLIQLPDEESKEVMDMLVDIHTRSLRGTYSAKSLPTLKDLQQLFNRLTVNWDRIIWSTNELPPLRADVIEKVFSARKVAAELHTGSQDVEVTLADRELLTQTCVLGASVSFPGVNEKGQLVWLSSHRSLYLFKRGTSGALVLYTCASFLDAMRQETVQPMERASLFERAVEVLLSGAKTLHSPST